MTWHHEGRTESLTLVLYTVYGRAIVHQSGVILVPITCHQVVHHMANQSVYTSRLDTALADTIGLMVILTVLQLG